MQWYEQLLEEYPNSPLREEIFAQKVFLADEQNNQTLVRETGENYLREYPKGQWGADVATLLGMEALERKDYSSAIKEFSDGVLQSEDKTLQRYVLRKRAQAYQGAGKRNLALEDLRQVVALKPQDMTDVVRLGDFLFDQGDFEDAESQYVPVLSSEAPVALKAWAKYRWGLSLEYQGKAGEAQKLLVEVRQLETRTPEFENTIRAAAVAVLDEFSLNGKPQAKRANEGS
jgi:tetratricopeptide (TPR) repeat protein